MFLNVVSLLVGFLCLFLVVLMLLNHQPNRHRNYRTNGYLVIILIVVGLQRFLYAVEALNFTNVTYSPLKINPLLAFYIVPVYYLFFCRLIYNTGQLKKELLHFIFPTVFILINLVIADNRINHVTYLIYSVLYFVLILAVVKKFIYKKKRTLLDKTSYRAKKSWVLLMVVLTLLLVVYSNCFVFFDLSVQMNLNAFYRYSSLFWFIILFFIFKNPLIIFGEHSLLKSVQLNEPQTFKVWSGKPLKAIERADAVVYNTIANKIDFIILEIKNLQKSVPFISSTILNTETLAKELKMPKRHLEVIFKYYCHYSINDCSNLVKIEYALSLINEGYLQKYTVDSLGKECLFNSRFTFYKNFKKFVGVSVSDFISNANSTAKDYRHLLSER